MYCQSFIRLMKACRTQGVMKLTIEGLSVRTSFDHFGFPTPSIKPRDYHIIPQTALGWWGPGGVGRGRCLCERTAAECPPRFDCVFTAFRELELATLQRNARETLELCKIPWF